MSLLKRLSRPELLSLLANYERRRRELESQTGNDYRSSEDLERLSVRIRQLRKELYSRPD